MKKQYYKNAHFLGSKIKHLRTINHLTMEDLIAKCFRENPESTPSISYLSLIENGKRNPSLGLMNSLCKIFQKKINWFNDKNVSLFKNKNLKRDQFEQIEFEPNFLFSKGILEKGIPSLLSQTGTTGRQFAHILIRTYQEKNKNQFPYLEKEAEKIGNKKFPIDINDILNLYKKNNLKIKWFNKDPFLTKNYSGGNIKTLFRSFYQSPNIIYVNKKMKKEPSRLKYDLATYLAHKILHNGDGIVSSHASGGEIGGSPRPFEKKTSSFNQEDILYAWRDFECSFFAGALLCPKIPFKRYIDRKNYDIKSAEKIGITPSVFMRRITSISRYNNWHYFDVYPPGYLRAVYRGDGIPMPWGNMRLVSDPCRQWGVFKLLENLHIKKPISQLSLLKQNKILKLYCSISLKTNDAANNPHIICLGLDLNNILKIHGLNIKKINQSIYADCKDNNGTAMINKNISKQINQIAKITNIVWMKEALENPINIICQRSTNCPRNVPCDNIIKTRKKISWINQIKDEILNK